MVLIVFVPYNPIFGSLDPVGCIGLGTIRRIQLEVLRLLCCLELPAVELVVVCAYRWIEYCAMEEGNCSMSLHALLCDGFTQDY